MNNFTLRTLALLSLFTLIFGLYKLRYPTIIHPVRAVYHWKTHFSWGYENDQFQQKFITDHQISKVYVKMLDVDWNEAIGIFPSSKTNVTYYNPNQQDSAEYIPVVYISAKALAMLEPKDIAAYANRFLKHALRIETYLEHPVSEIQVDCDWTKSTKEIYFQLIREMRKLAPKYKFSATIRLYPYKYVSELGVPPVDRGMLMLYNLKNARVLSADNSIFSFQEARKYVSTKTTYPIPLDFALPAFSWCTVFRNGSFYKVLFQNPMGEENVLKNVRLVRAGLYEVINAFELNLSTYLRPGDILKIEHCGENELLEANAICRLFPISEQNTIALFDLDETDLNPFNYETIENAYQITK